MRFAVKMGFIVSAACSSTAIAAEMEFTDSLSVMGGSIFNSTVTVRSQSSQVYAFGVQKPSSAFMLYVATSGNVGIGTNYSLAVSTAGAVGLSGGIRFAGRRGLQC